MKRIFLPGIFLLCHLCSAQVSIEKNKLVKDGVSYKFSKYENVFENAAAKDLFKKARTNKSVAEVFAYTGGFSLGFGIARLLSGGTKTYYVNDVKQSYKTKGEGWGFVAAGAGLIGIGIPFALAADKNAKKALQTENGDTTAFNPYFKLQTTGNGLAVTYHF